MKKKTVDKTWKKEINRENTKKGRAVLGEEEIV
jgi:hypothetical protein